MKFSALFLSLTFSSLAMAQAGHVKAPEVKRPTIILKSGFTKEQHMAAEASCRLINKRMTGPELKDCIKKKLGIIK